MGVVGGVQRFESGTLLRLAADPRELAWHLNGYQPRPKRVGFIDRLLGHRPEPSPRREWTPPPPEDSCYLDKAWHAIHFLLTGSALPATGPSSFLLSGRSILAGEIEVLLSYPSEVGEIAAALSEFDRTTLLARYDDRAMAAADIYVLRDAEAGDEELREYVLDYAIDLIEFIRAAAARGDGLVVSIQG